MILEVFFKIRVSQKKYFNSLMLATSLLTSLIRQ